MPTLPPLRKPARWGWVILAVIAMLATPVITASRPLNLAVVVLAAFVIFFALVKVER